MSINNMRKACCQHEYKFIQHTGYENFGDICQAYEAMSSREVVERYNIYYKTNMKHHIILFKLVIAIGSILIVSGVIISKLI